jgi:hypothetical protein
MSERDIWTDVSAKRFHNPNDACTHLDHIRRMVNVVPSIVELARHCRELEGSGLTRVVGDTIGALVKHPIVVADGVAAKDYLYRGSVHGAAL